MKQIYRMRTTAIGIKTLRFLIRIYDFVTEIKLKFRWYIVGILESKGGKENGRR